jgi:hypothetical protein
MSILAPPPFSWLFVFLEVDLSSNTSPIVQLQCIGVVPRTSPIAHMHTHFHLLVCRTD